MSTYAVLLVDDEQAILDIEREALAAIGITAETFVDPIQASKRLEAGDVSLVVTDWQMPGMTGMDLLFKSRALTQPPFVIVVTSYGTIDRAVQAMNEGAYHFLEKPLDIQRFVNKVKEALESCQHRAATIVAPLKSSGSKKAFEIPIIKSESMRHALGIANRTAPTESSVLLLGESGTGKELFADYIHHNSPRASGPIVRVNCGALPEHLMESALFGHEKGAFTGADRRNIGRFEQANGGTLFLDEIGDLLLPLQVKLLRALQERTIERVGSGTAISVDFRLVCATHCDLEAAVRNQKFREDLYYRINVVPIHVPPLRERQDEIEPLALHFLQLLRSKVKRGPESISKEAVQALRNFSWPGNVRQLRNAIEYALVMCPDALIRPEHLPEIVRAGIGAVPRTTRNAESNPSPAADPNRGPLEAAEAVAILDALTRHYWKATAAARELNISRSTLYEKMKHYGIKRPE